MNEDRDRALVVEQVHVLLQLEQRHRSAGRKANFLWVPLVGPLL